MSSAAAKADPSTSALLIIDVQRGFSHPTHWGTERSNALFENNLESLLRTFRSHASREDKGPYVFHVAHHSLDPASALHPSASDPSSTNDSATNAIDFYPYAKPLADGSEKIFIKNVNSAFIGTNLEAEIRSRGVKSLYVCGLTTDHCVSTSVRMAGNLNVSENVFLIGDATATWSRKEFDAETVMKVHLASLDGEFCTVVNTVNVEKMLQA